MTKVLFLDIDGTVVANDTKEAPESAYKAIRLARDNGHYIFLNSGRTIGQTRFLGEELGIDCFVLGCGTQVIVNGKSIFRNILTQERCDELKRIVREKDFDVVFETQEGAYFTAEPFKHSGHERMAEYLKCHCKTVFNCFDSEEKDFTFDKFCICRIPNGDNSEIYDFLYSLEDFTPIDRGRNFFEVVPKGCTKKTGMDKALEYIGLSYEDTLVFGDSINDLAMFQSPAKHKIVMGDHDSAIEKEATYIADKVTNDGLYKAMQHFNII